jgi:DNA-directed RNA polymerase subunit M/transcription elongation factor TFIIS
MDDDSKGSAEHRKCPKCGLEGKIENYRPQRLGQTSKWYFEYHCPHCGHDWKYEDKSK